MEIHLCMFIILITKTQAIIELIGTLYFSLS